MAKFFLIISKKTGQVLDAIATADDDSGDYEVEVMMSNFNSNFSQYWYWDYENTDFLRNQLYPDQVSQS